MTVETAVESGARTVLPGAGTAADAAGAAWARPAVQHRYEGWELQVDAHQLVVQGQPVKVGRPAFKLLLALSAAVGRVVSKDDLLAAAWPGRVVEDNNLTVQIAALRRLLGAGAIRNVSGLGYRLVAVPLPAPPPPSALAALPALSSPVLPAAGTERSSAASPLFGRAADFAAVADLLGSAPLVSIVGTGGVGKTSLARALLGRGGASWRDGVHWIDLAPLHRGAPLQQIVAEALSVQLDDPDQVADGLSRLHALIVLDNCEHVLADVAAFVAAVLRPGASVRWLVTSQQPLGLVAESVYRLNPLQVPLPGAAGADALDSGALALFQARVGAADHGFQMQPEALLLAAEVCRQLDGLPLAIEMAAARVATLGLQLVHDQIDQRLRLRAATRGAPPRHHTLLQTYDWSYGLLSPTEQHVFCWLEPFVGGFTPQMALQQVCGGDDSDRPALTHWETLDALSALVEKSLVQRIHPATAMAPGRLQLLESARDYARLQLDATGDTARVHRRHAVIVADAFELAPYELERWRDVDWAAKYGPERRNVGAALHWACIERDPTLLARLVAALAQLDTFALSKAEVVQYPVPVDVLQLAPLPERARACMEFGWAHYLSVSRETGTALLESALADFETLADAACIYGTLTRLIRMVLGRPGMAARAGAMWARLQQIDERLVPLRSRLLCSISVATMFAGGHDTQHLGRLQRIAQSAGFDGHAATCQLHITNALLLDGRFEEAAAAASSLLRTPGAGLGLHALTHHNLALALVRLGRFDEAHSAAQKLMRAMPSADHLVLDLFAFVALRRGRVEDAALMAGHSAHIKRERDWCSEPLEAALISETTDRLAADLGQDVCASLLQMGAAMATPKLLALALAMPEAADKH